MNTSRGWKHTAGFTFAAAAAVLLGLAIPAQTQTSDTPALADPAYLKALIELARPEVRERKAETIRQSMDLTESEASGFWPLHADYEKEQTKLFDERLALIEQFGKSHETMTDNQAEELARKSFDLEARRAALKKKYWPRFEKVVSPKKAARFFQLDNQINMAIDLSIVARLPLIK